MGAPEAGSYGSPGRRLISGFGRHARLNLTVGVGGMSDRGLGKACRRLLVPVPPRGYWARLEAGQKPGRPRLPKLKSREIKEIVVGGVVKPSPARQRPS